MEEIYSVDAVCFHINKSIPPQLIIQATGTVTSSGWSNGKLEPVQYIDPPHDGIQEFTFVAKPPTGNVLWVMTPIAGVGVIERYEWVKGIKVTASGVSVVAMLDYESCSVEAREL